MDDRLEVLAENVTTEIFCAIWKDLGRLNLQKAKDFFEDMCVNFQNVYQQAMSFDRGCMAHITPCLIGTTLKKSACC